MDHSQRPDRVTSRISWAQALILAWCLHWLLSLPSALAGDNWKFETLHLKTGRALHGLISKEGETTIEFKCVLRPPGEPSSVVETTVRRDEIKRIDRLEGKDRTLLEARVQALSRAGEKRRIESLEVKVGPWGSDPKGGLSYKSAYFLLRSDTRENIVRRAALRLEQIYAAYVGYLPPRHPAGQPTTILLVKSRAEYQEMLQKQGHRLLNPAFFDGATNQIVCASNLERLGDELEAIRKEQKELLAQLKVTEAKLRKEAKGQDLQERLREIEEARERIRATQLKNDLRFARATQRLFRTLYHEAFHAYLANFVYTSAEASVPRWLNEGLAQIFETAVIDGDELLVGRPEEERLKAVKAAEQRQGLIPLDDLLRAEGKSFLVAHGGDQQVSDRYYLTSWALAFYLTFERKLLSTPELDDYVRVLKKGAEPGEAFAELVGQPIPEFEKAFHLYLRGLRGNGRTTRPTSETSGR
jgi:hypothetical protein